MGLNGVSPESAATQLERIFSSEIFGKSSQTSRLLRYVVERTLQGRADEIKENVLGVEVFGRQSFDPRTDPIVRVEATRLRQKLAYYYESEGKRDTIRIILPKGTYVPILEPQPAPPPAAPPFPRREKLAWSVSALFALTALAFAFAYLGRSPAEADLLKLSILPPDQASFAGFPANISPDGRRLAFAAAKGSQTRLWIRTLNSLDAQSLSGTEGASLPFWSPDSRTVGFFAAGKLKRVDVAGGAVQTLCDAPGPRGGTWNRDGVILFSLGDRTGIPLYRVPAGGGTPIQETHLDSSSMESGHRWPQFLPDGTHFLYTVRFHRRDQAIYLGKLGSTDRTRLASVDSSSAFVQIGRNTGYLLFVREGALVGLRIDMTHFQVVGEPFTIARPVGYDPVTSQAAFSVSGNGVLAYSSDDDTSTEQLVWRERGGRTIGAIDMPGYRYIYPSLSPDGSVVAIASLGREPRTFRIWQFNLTSGTPSQFTFGSSEGEPVWSPDGKQIAFPSERAPGHYDLFVKASSGAEGERLLLRSDRSKSPSSWSPDGRFLLFDQKEGPATERDLWMLPLAADAKPVPILKTPADEYAARFSPDGRWIAYTSDESGREEVNVQGFPPNGNKRQISHEGGSWPEWRRDGNELFYISADRQVMAAALADKNTLTFGPPKALFPASRGRLTGFAVTADGQRFLMNMLNEGSQSSPVTVVINWTSGIP